MANQNYRIENQSSLFIWLASNQRLNKTKKKKRRGKERALSIQFPLLNVIRNDIFSNNDKSWGRIEGGWQKNNVSNFFFEFIRIKKRKKNTSSTEEQCLSEIYIGKNTNQTIDIYLNKMKNYKKKEEMFRMKREKNSGDGFLVNRFHFDDSLNKISIKV